MQHHVLPTEGRDNVQPLVARRDLLHPQQQQLGRKNLHLLQSFIIAASCASFNS